jgi:hypothetical protein
MVAWGPATVIVGELVPPSVMPGSVLPTRVRQLVMFTLGVPAAVS